jgi:hypothetical protein
MKDRCRVVPCCAVLCTVLLDEHRYIDTYIHTYIHIHVCVCVCVCVCVYIFMYVGSGDANGAG